MRTRIWSLLLTFCLLLSLLPMSAAATDRLPGNQFSVSNTQASKPALTITSQPKNTSGTAGGTAVFTVKATGDDLTYQWQYQDAGGSWQNSASTSDTAKCAITIARDGRLYRCKVTDRYGSTATSSSAKLTVKPAITAQPKHYNGSVGDTAIFTVKATGVDLAYQWQYSDDSGRTWQNSKSTSASAACAITASRNGRLYHCEITDGHGMIITSSDARLTVKNALKITAQPQDTVGAAGETVSFTVKAAGDGLQYQWQYSDDSGKTWKNSSSTGETAKCAFQTGRNGRLYRCIITDQYGETVTSAPAAMTLKNSITIQSQPKNYSGAVGQTATFTVKATGDGLTYQWQYQDAGGSWKNSSSTSETAKCAITEARDGRLYRCKVTDRYGSTVTTSSAMLTVKPSITQQPQDFSGNVGDTAVFTVKATGVKLTYQWQYSDDGGNTWSSTGSATDRLTCVLQALDDNRQVRCVITDRNGAQAVSEAAKIRVSQLSSLPEDLSAYQEQTSSVNDHQIRSTSFVYGSSELGRDLVGWCIAPAAYSRTILLNFEIHGWEDSYAADGQLLVDLGNAVVSRYAGAAELYGCRLIVIPSCNPDGLAEGTTNNGFGRCNASGIDLNRDFDADYQSYSSARNYTPYAFSGAESRALRDLVLAAAPEIVIDFHGWENCTIGNSDVAEVFSLCAGLNHKNEFSTAAHGYFAHWAEQQGAKGLLVEFKSPETLNHDNVFRALDLLVQNEYGTSTSQPKDAAYDAFCPIKAYALREERVYVQPQIGGAGTSYGYIDGGSDLCEIVQVYENGWCKVRYPVSNYTKTGYCLFSNFVDPDSAIQPYSAHTSATESVYTRSDASTKFGSVWSTDTFSVVSVQGEMAQIIYPLDSGGYKMGWIPKSAMNE